MVDGEGNMWMCMGGEYVNRARYAFVRPGEGEMVRSQELQAKEKFACIENMRPQATEVLYAFSAN